MTQHTKSVHAHSQEYATSIRDSQGNIVAMLTGDGHEANAAFICRACNNHDALVTATTEVHEILGEYLLADSQEERDYLRGDLEHAQNKLFAALDAARGKVR